MATSALLKFPTAELSRAARADPFASSPIPSKRPQSLRSPWLGAKILPVLSCYLRVCGQTHRVLAATVSSSLPISNPERISSHDKAPKWSWKAIKAFAMAELEARKLRYPNTGTEALLLGILIEGTSLASKFLRANGITFFKVQEEIAKQLGKGDRYFFSPEHPPLTEDAQRALDLAAEQNINSGGHGEISTGHVLLTIWSQAESPGHKILAALGFDEEKAKELESIISDPEFVDE